MASKRRLRRKERRRSCLDKQAWPSQQLAEQHVAHLIRRNRKDPMTARAGFLKPYRCKFCDAWHIGNSKNPSSMDRFIGMLKRKGVLTPAES